MSLPRGALDARRIAVLGQMGVLERHPLHFAEIEAVVLRENAAQPYARGLRKGAHADSAAGQVLRPHRAAFGIVQHGTVLKAPKHRGRHQRQRLAVSLGLQIADDRHFAHVELLLAHHHAERLVDRIDLGEVQDNPLGFDVAFFQRLGVRVSPEADVQSLDLFGSDRVHAGSSRVRRILRFRAR